MPSEAPITTHDLPSASVVKRLLALGYDVFILVALSMAYSALATLFMKLALHISAGDYQPMQRGPWFLVGWLLTLVGFYWFFWYRGGQTIGMKTWRLKLVSRAQRTADEEQYPKVTHIQCLIRVATGPISLAALGLGYFWQWLDKDQLTFHDRLSNTKVIQLPKPEKKPKK